MTHDPESRLASRPHPFDLIFGGFRAERLPAIRAALGAAAGLDAFVLAAPALELLRDVRPDDGLGDGVEDLVALVHAAYLFWRDGEQTVALTASVTRRLCAPAPPVVRASLAPTTTQYVQIAPSLVWGQLVGDGPFEPLDGWFIGPGTAGFRLVACFGVHPQRPGVSVVTTGGPLLAAIERPDGTDLFAPTMPGGAAAHLFAVSTPEELRLLALRTAAGDEVTSWR